MIADKIQQAHLNPEKDYHLKADIERAVRLIESEGSSHELVEQELAAAENDHPIFGYIEALEVWESSDNDDFENGILLSLGHLDAAYENAIENNWISVASFCLLKSIEYREELGGYNPEEEFETVVDFLTSEFLPQNDVNLSSLGELLNKIIEHGDSTDDQVLEDALEVASNRADILREKQRFMQERTFLDYSIELRRQLDEEIYHLEDRKVASFEEEFDLKSSANSSIKADVLERAVAECRELIDDDKENQWRNRIRELNKEAIDEMPRIEHEVDLSDQISNIVDFFVESKEQYSSWQALIDLIYTNSGTADYESAIEQMGEAPAANLFPRNVLSSQGDTVGIEPGMIQEGERAPAGYIQETRAQNHALTVALQRLIDRQLLRESDFYIVLKLIPGTSIQDEAFLTDAIISFFEERHAESIHLAIPRLESITANVFEEKGRAVTKNHGQVYRQKGLGGLFGIIEEEIDVSYGKYLQYKYTNPSGINLRNKTAHGQLRYSEAGFKTASILLFDILRTGARIANASDMEDDTES